MVLLVILSPSLTTGSLAVVSVCASFFQSHFVVGGDSVVLLWLPSTVTTQRCALRD